MNCTSRGENKFHTKKISSWPQALKNNFIKGDLSWISYLHLFLRVLSVLTEAKRGLDSRSGCTGSACTESGTCLCSQEGGIRAARLSYSSTNPCLQIAEFLFHVSQLVFINIPTFLKANCYHTFFFFFNIQQSLLSVQSATSKSLSSACVLSFY